MTRKTENFLPLFLTTFSTLAIYSGSGYFTKWKKCSGRDNDLIPYEDSHFFFPNAQHYGLIFFVMNRYVYARQPNLNLMVAFVQSLVVASCRVFLLAKTFVIHCGC